MSPIISAIYSGFLSFFPSFFSLNIEKIRKKKERICLGIRRVYTYGPRRIYTYEGLAARWTSLVGLLGEGITVGGAALAGVWLGVKLEPSRSRGV